MFKFATWVSWVGKKGQKRMKYPQEFCEKWIVKLFRLLRALSTPSMVLEPHFGTCSELVGIESSIGLPCCRWVCRSWCSYLQHLVLSLPWPFQATWNESDKKLFQRTSWKKKSPTFDTWYGRNRWKPHLRVPPIPANSLLFESAAFLRKHCWCHWSRWFHWSTLITLITQVTLIVTLVTLMIITCVFHPTVFRWCTWCPAWSTWSCPSAGRKGLDLHPEKVTETLKTTIF